MAWLKLWLGYVQEVTFKNDHGVPYLGPSI